MVLYYADMNIECLRHRNRFLVWMAVYCAVIFADAYWLPRPERTDAIHVLGALLPMIPLIFAGLETVASVRAMDELQRRIHMEGMLLGITGISIVMLSVGLLQFMVAVPTFSIFWLWPALCVFYGLGTAIARRRYA